MKKNTQRKMQTQVSNNELVRQAAKGRKEKKRKNEVGIACLVIAVLLVVAVAAAVVFLKVGSISVKGNNGRYSDSQIAEIAGITPETGFLTLQSKKINETVCLALPYIESVAVERSFPDAVALQVQYCEADFAVDCGQLWLLLNRSGKVLETLQYEPSGVTGLDGVVITEYTVGKPATFEAPACFQYARTVLESCEENGIGQITAMQVAASGTVSFTVNERFYVSSGSVHVLENKAAVLKTVMDERENRLGNFNFTVAADGSITVGKRDMEEPVYTNPLENNPNVDMDSELVDGGDASAAENASGNDIRNEPQTEKDSDDFSKNDDTLG